MEKHTDLQIRECGSHYGGDLQGNTAERPHAGGLRGVDTSRFDKSKYTTNKLQRNKLELKSDSSEENLDFISKKR